MILKETNHCRKPSRPKKFKSLEMMQRGFKERGTENGKGTWRASNKLGAYKVHEGIGTDQSHFRNLEVQITTEG